MKEQETRKIFEELKQKSAHITREELRTLRDLANENDELRYELEDFINELHWYGYFNKYTTGESAFIADNSFILPLVLANDTHGKIKIVGDNIYMFLCQMHVEHTPSMAVNDIRNFYGCFGCGYYGGPIKYIEMKEHLVLRDALDLLTQIFLIDIKKPNKELAPLAEKYQKAILSSRYKELLEMGKERLIKRRELPLNEGYPIDCYDSRIDVPRNGNLEEAYQKRYGTIERVEKGIYLPYGKE